VGTPLLVLILVVVAIYVVAGVWRYLRQTFQTPRDDD
jgi:hypothetical protein